MWHRQRASGQGESMWREWCGSSGVAAAADGSSWTEPAGDDQSGSRACVRAGAQTWRSHLRGRQRGRSERASGSWRTFFEFTPHSYAINLQFYRISAAACIDKPIMIGFLSKHVLARSPRFKLALNGFRVSPRLRLRPAQPDASLPYTSGGPISGARDDDVNSLFLSAQALLIGSTNRPWQRSRPRQTCPSP